MSEIIIGDPLKTKYVRYSKIDEREAGQEHHHDPADPNSRTEGVGSTGLREDRRNWRRRIQIWRIQMI
jgi:hypothetical protein